MSANPCAALGTLSRIARRHGNAVHSEVIDNILSRGTLEPARIWEALDTDEVWGGAGSVADLSLAANSSLTEAETRADELVWRNTLIALNDGMLANGVRNPRAGRWASAFLAWNAMGDGV